MADPKNFNGFEKQNVQQIFELKRKFSSHISQSFNFNIDSKISSRDAATIFEMLQNQDLNKKLLYKIIDSSVAIVLEYFK
jgi:hypothetical protein